MERVIAFVLALGEGGDVADALAEAREAEPAAVFVLAAPGRTDEALEAVRTAGRAGRKGKMLVQAIEDDPAAAEALSLELGNRELDGLPAALLETARVLAESSLDDYGAALFIDTEQQPPRLVERSELEQLM